MLLLGGVGEVLTFSPEIRDIASRLSLQKSSFPGLPLYNRNQLWLNDLRVTDSTHEVDL
jgi:hypothetical protein